MIRETLVALGLMVCLTPAFVHAQTAPPATPKPAAATPPPPAIRRWLDVQQLSMGGRFRWYKNSAGRLVSSTLQWQPQARARFLFDKGAKYSLNAFASSGATFVSSWNNTGGGIGEFARPWGLKQLFLQAEPVKGLEFQAGGLHMNRGEMAEHITYDSDAYIVGERVTVRPSKGRITQVAVTAAYFGDFREPNVFNRLDRMSEFNYGQALVGFKLSERVAASVDYTSEVDRDIIREGVNIRMPASVKYLTLLKLESYQRRSSDLDDGGAGFNASADVRWKRLSVTGGVMSVDKNYGACNGPCNGDRYETGKRWYTIGTVSVFRDLTVGWFQTEAFATDFPINLKHRFDLLITYNPTASLKRAGIF